MSPNTNLHSIQIRQANQDDIPSIVRLVRELAESGGERSPLAEDYAAYFLHQPNCYVLLAETEDQIIGLLSYLMTPNLYHASDTCTIPELIVTDGFRGRGVGSALMDDLIEHMASQGCVEVSVSTMPNNQGAIQFYKKHGLVDEALLLERHLRKSA